MTPQQIEKVCIQGCNLRGNDPTASRDLARFLCLLPCLTDLTIKNSGDQHEDLFLRDDFYHELSHQASSSKVIYKVYNVHLEYGALAIWLTRMMNNETVNYFVPQFTSKQNELNRIYNKEKSYLMFYYIM